jgi:hypothetical protein
MMEKLQEDNSYKVSANNGYGVSPWELPENVEEAQELH